MLETSIDGHNLQSQASPPQITTEQAASPKDCLAPSAPLAVSRVHKPHLRMANSPRKDTHHPRTVRRSSREDRPRLLNRQSFRPLSLCHPYHKLSMLQTRHRLPQQPHLPPPNCFRLPHTHQTKRIISEASGRPGHRLSHRKSRTRQCSGQPQRSRLSQVPLPHVVLRKQEARSLIGSLQRLATRPPYIRSTTHLVVVVPIAIEDRAVAIHVIAGLAEEVEAQKKKVRDHLFRVIEIRRKGVRRLRKRPCYRKPFRRRIMRCFLTMPRILREQ